MNENLNIFIVEDEAIIARDIANKLKNLGYNVAGHAMTGEEAIEKILSIRPDMVLMDIRLNGNLDGIDTAKKIYSQFEVPIIYVTAYMDKNTLARAKITEPYGYIMKPFEERDLYIHIELAFYKHQAQKKLTENKEIIKALEKEKEMGEIRKKFVSMISHDFRTPLSTVLSSIELIEYYGERLGKEEKGKLFVKIKDAITKMTSFLDDVLTIGRIESGKLIFRPEKFLLKRLSISIIDELSKNTNCKINFIYDTDNECVLDEILIRHIITNLLSNAIKFSYGNGDIVFHIYIQEGYIIFEIKDYGIGIPNDEQEKLFEPFYRGKNVGKISGTGLGLLIVKLCVELHGGFIIINSAVNEGTAAKVFIPIGGLFNANSCN
jgi:signal transduction histidine kinase